MTFSETQRLEQNNSVVPASSTQKNKRLFFAILVLLILNLLALLFTIFTRNSRLNSSSEQVVGNKDFVSQIISGEDSEVIPFSETEVYQDLSSTLNNIGNKQVEYVTNEGGVQTFYKNFSYSAEESIDIGVSVYQYKSGGIFESGYEGISWQRDSDSEVAITRNLKPGTFITESPFVSSDSPNTYSVITTVGPQEKPIFSYNNGFFWASKSVFRHYFFWLEKSQQLVEITIIFPADEIQTNSQEICYKQYCGTAYLFDSKAAAVFKDIEKLIYFIPDSENSI